MKGLRNQKDLSFGTSLDNELGLKLKLEYHEDTKISYGQVEIPLSFQGHQHNCVHPGIISVLLDEVMMNINQAMNLEVITGELTIRYLQAAQVDEPLHFRGYFVKKNRRIIEHRAELEDDIGKIIARAKGKYIEVDPLENEK